MKKIKDIKDVIVGTIFVCMFFIIIFISKLFQNNAGRDWSLDIIFSKKNIYATLEDLFIFTLVVLPILVILKYILRSKKIEE